MRQPPQTFVAAERPFFKIAPWLLAAMIAAFATAATPDRAAERPSRLHRIVAVGDLHGDFAAWRAIAGAAGLIDAKGRWAGGDTVLVQAGDVVDRGPDSIDILHDLMRLEREAPRAHGRVIALVGNHEAMNMTGDLRYVSPSDFAAFTDANSVRRRDNVYTANQSAIEVGYRRRDSTMKGDAIRKAWLEATPLGQVEHDAAWAPDGFIGRWVVGHPAVALLDDTLFVHGGLSASYACLGIAEINRRVAAALRAREISPGSIINDPAGPLWYRGLVMRDDDDPTSSIAVVGPCNPAASSSPPSMAEELEADLRTYGARRMVIAHTPILSGISVLDDGRLVRIDTGISAVFGGKLSYLEILDGALSTHVVERPPGSSAGAH